MRLIDADDFANRMYHEAFEKDSDLQKWDSGCWIRYKLFENVLREQPTVQPEIIRCKDCRFNDGSAYCELHFRDVKGEDFCSWAERRNNDL